MWQGVQRGILEFKAEHQIRVSYLEGESMNPQFES